jgi:hypothetical protein
MENMGKITKSLLLAQIMFRNPPEFLDRLEAAATSRLEKRIGRQFQYPAISATETIAKVRELFQGEVNLDEVEKLESEVAKRMQLLEGIAPFTTAHHADFSLARLCYIVCRFLRPDIVVETGVAYGVTTAFILKALESNGKGNLHSVDLPPLGKNADKFVGYLVPEELKDRWVLHRGVSKRVFPELLPQLKKVDIFVHDSLHTYWNIRYELQSVTPYLSRPAIVIADDIQNNSAFQEWALKTSPTTWWTFQETDKDSVAGLAVFLLRSMQAQIDFGSRSMAHM